LKIPFNKIFVTGKEIEYIQDAVKRNCIGGGSYYSGLCEALIKDRYSYNNCYTTSSCTDALEIISLLTELEEGDEVILPSYTFVSTANIIMLRKAVPVFADSHPDSPNIDPAQIEKLITKKTKAVIVVHYSGIACDMDRIKEITDRNNIFLIEDSAHSIDSYYKGIPLGSIGDFSAFSFHETKNITAGEGGMLIVNDGEYADRAEILREKGTNRAKYLKGEVNKYEWVDVGSSYVSSELNMAFLFAQLENIEIIQQKRINAWNFYYNALKQLESINIIKLPYIPDYATNNAHIFYMICSSNKERNDLIKYLAENNISSAFHYLSLHKSPFYRDKYTGDELVNSDMYSERLVRLPLYTEIRNEELMFITEKVKVFYNC
jgi:dTDP-4-amino-4,6-dideoxygalactose transaminase